MQQGVRKTHFSLCSLHVENDRAKCKVKSFLCCEKFVLSASACKRGILRTVFWYTQNSTFPPCTVPHDATAPQDAVTRRSKGFELGVKSANCRVKSGISPDLKKSLHFAHSDFKPKTTQDNPGLGLAVDFYTFVFVNFDFSCEKVTFWSVRIELYRQPETTRDSGWLQIST